MFRKGDEPIPGYRLEKFLGKGQFGEVWRTTAPGGTSAALKFIDLGGKQGLKEFRGVQRVKEIRHANLMPITALWLLDAEGNILSDRVLESYNPEKVPARATLNAQEPPEGAHPEWLVVAMLLGKKNLMDRLEECTAAGQSGIPVDELLRYMEEAAKGIDYLNTPQHDLGQGPVALQHCDIKPANIMLIGDAAVVCDFGLARVLSDSTATATGMVGSPAYMPPECIGRKPGPWSDQYALAVSYVEMRTGKLPFKELTYIEVLESNRQANLELSNLPPAEAQVIRKATSLKPEDRFPSTLAMVHALRRAVEGVAQPEGARRSWPLVAGLLAAVVVLPIIVWMIVEGGGRGSNGAGKTPVTTISRYSITIEPPDATVSVNGAPPKQLTDGKLPLELTEGDSVTIEVSHTSGDYLPWKRQYRPDERTELSVPIRLEHSGVYHARRALELLAQENLPAAVDEYRQAIRVDAQFEVPQPIVLTTRPATQATARVEVLAASPDGKWLAAGDDGGVASLWSLADPRNHPSPIVLRGHAPQQALIESLAISPDSHWLVTGSWDRTAMVWDLAAADPSQGAVQLAGHSEGVTATAVTADNRWIVTASLDASVRLWSLADGKPSTQGLVLSAHQAEVNALRVSPDGQRLISVDVDGQAVLWDLTAANPKEAHTSLGHWPLSRKVLLLTPDGKWVIMGTEQGKVVVVPSDGSSTPREFACSEDKIEALALDATGTCLWVGDTLGGVFRCDFLAAEGTLSNPVPASPNHHAGPCVVIKAATRESFVVTGSTDGTARYWDVPKSGLAAVQFVSLSGDKGPITAMAVTPDGKWIATATENGSVLLWEVARCRLILHATGGALPSAKARVDT